MYHLRGGSKEGEEETTMDVMETVDGFFKRSLPRFINRCHQMDSGKRLRVEYFLLAALIDFPFIL